jgi:hypothetical protein
LAKTNKPHVATPKKMKHLNLIKNRGTSIQDFNLLHITKSLNPATHPFVPGGSLEGISHTCSDIKFPISPCLRILKEEKRAAI